MAIGAAVFDGQRVKIEDIEQHLVVVERRRFHVDPNYRLLVF